MTNETDGRVDQGEAKLDELAVPNFIAAILAEALVRGGALSIESLRASIEAPPESIGPFGKFQLRRFLNLVEDRLRSP